MLVDKLYKDIEVAWKDAATGWTDEMSCKYQKVVITELLSHSADLKANCIALVTASEDALASLKQYEAAL